MAQKDIVDTPRLLLVLGSGILVTIASIYAVEGLYHWGERDQFAKKNDNSQPRELLEVRANGAAMLSGYRIADADKKRYVIPIDKAMDAVIHGK